MIEKHNSFTVTNDKVIERIIDYDAGGINHMVLPKGEGLPIHFANAPVYMIVVRGEITLALDEQDHHTYPAGSILEIPYQTKMDVKNLQDEVTELFVVKAPGPRSMSTV